MKPFCITVIGAESTGKSTLSRQLAERLGADWVPEFARPYLETTGASVTRQSMRAIWYGQRALQAAFRTSPRRYVVYDTDLFATIGYWQIPHVMSHLGPCPEPLVDDAARLASDLYVIVLSNIPFERDTLRYGGDHRESRDDHWIELCRYYGLPYVVIDSADTSARLAESLDVITKRSTVCVAL